MNSPKLSWLAWLFALLMLSPTFIQAQDPPPVEDIRLAIDGGVSWLVDQQFPDGHWGGNETVAQTGFVLTKLCDYAYETGYDPFDPEYPYFGAVEIGFDFLLRNGHNNYGPDGGIYFSNFQHHESYHASVSLMAIANCMLPDRYVEQYVGDLGVTTLDALLQEMVEYEVFAQNKAGWPTGGWGYEALDNGWSDNSNSGYPALALRFAEAKGATIPQSLRDYLDIWINYIQNDVNGDAEDGGSGYTDPNNWVNMLKTGNLLVQMALYGDDVETQRVVDAVDYIERHWNDPEIWNDIQAMFNVMKGLEGFGIETLSVGADEVNWYAVMAQFLLNTQIDGTHWNFPTDWTDNPLDTVFALYVLEKTAPPPRVVAVDFDVHPTSWPNPINMKAKGVLPTAILGREDFDVTAIDPTTLLLNVMDREGEGVAPLWWAYEDVVSVMPDENGCNATEYGPDGFMDLTLKFDYPAVVGMLPEDAERNDTFMLVIGGNLIDDGLPIFGDDCVVIKNIAKSSDAIPSSFELAQNYPNPFNPSTSITFALPTETQVNISVFDVLGRLVETVVEDSFGAGVYTVDFNAARLPSGLYIYRITTPEFTDTRSMLLQK